MQEFVTIAGCFAEQIRSKDTHQKSEQSNFGHLPSGTLAASADVHIAVSCAPKCKSRV